MLKLWSFASKFCGRQDSTSDSSQLLKRYDSISKRLCFITLGISTSTLVGWTLAIPALTHIIWFLPAMQPNTAIGLIVGSLAILKINTQKLTTRFQVLPTILALFLMALGGATLSQYILGWDAGIDRFFFNFSPSNLQPFPGRISPQAAFNFLVLGFGILVFTQKIYSIYFGQAAAVLIINNVVISITGYFFNFHSHLGLPGVSSPAIGLAANSALGFILLTFALLARRPQEGLMQVVSSPTRTGKLTRNILLSSILAPLFAGLLFRFGLNAAWYDKETQISLFGISLIGFIILTTWRTAKLSVHKELRAQEAFEEIKRINEELHKVNQERQIFAALIEYSRDFIGIADPQGKPLYVNPAGRNMVGLDPTYPIETTQILDYYAPDQRDFASQTILPSMLNQGYWQGETKFIHWQSRKAIPVSDAHFVVQDSQSGKTLGLATITRDISELKHAHTMLQLTENRLDLAVRGANLATWDWHIQTGQVVFNERWAEMRGYSLEEIKPNVESFLSGIHPDDAPYVQKTIEKHFTGSSDEYECEFRVATKTGNWIWILDRGRIFERDEAGRPVRMVGTELDITERKRIIAEDQDTYLRKRLEALVIENIPALIAYIDDRECYRYMNREYEIWFGIPRDKILLKSMTDVLGQQAYATLKDKVALALGGEKVTFERKIPYRNAGTRWAEVTYIPDRNAEGKVCGFVVYVVDVSERRRIEEKACAATCQMAMEGLNLKKEKLQAESASRAKSEFLAHMSHEIRTPLAAIIGYTDLLATMVDSDSSPFKLIDILKRNSHHLNSLVNDILDFSRIESGHDIEVTCTVFNLKELFTTVINMFRLQAERKHLDLIYAEKSLLPTYIETDEKLLRQIIINLLGNALKFTSTGSIELVASFNQAAPALTITVRDSGVGISAQDQSLIFEAFAQSPTTKKSLIYGSGLGLTLSRYMARKMGGEVKLLRSELGKGSTFEVHIPIGIVDSPPEITQISSSIMLPCPSALKGISILLIEDNDDLRQLVETVLSNAGAQVTAVGDGSIGVQYCQEKKYDLVLLDIQLPGIDGHEVVQIIHANNPSIPVVALTANATRSEKDKCRRSGFDAYETKPISLPHLSARVLEWIANKQTQLTN